MRILGIVVLGAALSGCAIQRAQIAQDARAQMVGMSKEQVLTCMGAPANKAAEGATEVWGYASGNGMTVASASYDRYGGTAVASSRFCNTSRWSIIQVRPVGCSLLANSAPTLSMPASGRDNHERQNA